MDPKGIQDRDRLGGPELTLIPRPRASELPARSGRALRRVVRPVPEGSGCEREARALIGRGFRALAVSRPKPSKEL
jgi:hypothetical protein